MYWDRKDETEQQIEHGYKNIVIEIEFRFSAADNEENQWG